MQLNSFHIPNKLKGSPMHEAPAMRGHSKQIDANKLGAS